jgi:hypothetical protein
MKPKFPSNQRSLAEYGLGSPVPARRLGDILERLVQITIGRHERLSLLQDLWPKVVGETLRNLCQPMRIVGLTLTIRVANDAVARELILLREKLLDRIRSLPDLEHLRSFRISPRQWNGQASDGA